MSREPFQRQEVTDSRPADHRPGAELIQRDARLQSEHHPGEGAGQQDHGQRPDANRVELEHDVLVIERPGENAATRLPEHAHVLLHFEERGLDPLDSAGRH